MMHFLLLLKLASMPLKNRFRLAIIIPGKYKYILLNKNVRTCNYLQCTCKYIPQGLYGGFHVVSAVSDGSCWFPLVILGYHWLPLVIAGYPWLYLVITWLSTIEIYVKSFTHLQLSFQSFAEIFCSCGQIK